MVSGEDVPEVTVEVMGEELSEISPQEELKVHSNCMQARHMEDMTSAPC